MFLHSCGQAELRDPRGSSVYQGLPSSSSSELVPIHNRLPAVKFVTRPPSLPYSLSLSILLIPKSTTRDTDVGGGGVQIHTACTLTSALPNKKMAMEVGDNEEKRGDCRVRIQVLRKGEGNRWHCHSQTHTRMCDIGDVVQAAMWVCPPGSQWAAFGPIWKGS